MSTTPGWLIVAIVRASPRKRSAEPGSSSSAGSSTLIATVRPSTSSVPRHTSPMPPPAMRSSRRYRPPNMVPGLSMCLSVRPDRSDPARSSRQALLADVRLHDLPGDPGRLGAAALARVLEEHRGGDHRLVALHREGDEPAVRLGLGRVLRGTGLAAHLEAGDAGVLAATVVDD